MKCSALNQHLFLCNLIDSPLCTCGKIESASHFLLYCPNYISLRDKYITPLQTLCNITCNVLLFGNENLTNDENKYIFIKVQRFILKTKRFSKWISFFFYCFQCPAYAIVTLQLIPSSSINHVNTIHLHTISSLLSLLHLLLHPIHDRPVHNEIWETNWYKRLSLVFHLISEYTYFCCYVLIWNITE